MRTLCAELRPHPATHCDAIRRFAVTVEPESSEELRVQFRIEGEIGRLRLPLPEIARRRDGLWQHSCFEAFLQPDASDIYYEFNFAPSLDWASYRFGGRREHRTSPGMARPPFTFKRNPDHCELTAEIPLAALPELAGAPAIQAGMAAVIESDDGSLSYWALAHGGAKPDFHDPTSFTLRVTRA